MNPLLKWVLPYNTGPRERVNFFSLNFSLLLSPWLAERLIVKSEMSSGICILLFLLTVKFAPQKSCLGHASAWLPHSYTSLCKKK